MIPTVDALTSHLVGLAMDAANLRHATHASNIAMAGTPGHVPMSVSFEEHLAPLRDALQSGHSPDSVVGDLVPAQVVRSTQDSVQLDQEVAAMSRNALHYQALTKLIGRHYALVATAIDGGRR